MKSQNNDSFKKIFRNKGVSRQLNQGECNLGEKIFGADFE